MKQHILLFLLITHSLLVGAGCTPTTLIITPAGEQKISSLKFGDTLVSYSSGEGPTINSVTALAFFQHTECICFIDEHGQRYIVAPGQQFINALNNEWFEARHLAPEIPLLCCDDTFVRLHRVSTEKAPHLLIDLTVEPHHTYCLAPHGIVTHNTDATLVSGAASACGGLGYALSGPVGWAVGGASLLGAAGWVILDLFSSGNKQKRQAPRATSKKHQSKDTTQRKKSSATPPPPKKDDDKKKKKKENKKTGAWHDKQNFENSERVEKSIEYATRNNQLRHIFGPKSIDKHKLKPLVDLLGSDVNVTRAAFQALFNSGLLPSSDGIFEDILVNVEGYIVSIRGYIDSGIVKLGTMFVID